VVRTIMALRVLDLFSGIGGMSLGLAPVSTTIAFCDIDERSRAVISDRMAQGFFVKAPIMEDVRQLTRASLLKVSKTTNIDVLAAGFPCQDVSIMNKAGKGIQGARSGLVSEVFRIAKELKPSVVFLENSPNLEYRGLDTVLETLESLGYSKSACGVYAASDVGAPHQRRRMYIMAVRKGTEANKVVRTLSEIGFDATDLPWKKKAPVRVVLKTPASVENLRNRGFLLGNSVVPACVRHAARSLSSAIIGGRTGDISSHVRSVDACDIVMHVPTSKRLPGGQTAYRWDAWSTPLSSRWTSTRIGSRRTSRILQNQILYEKNTLAYMKERGSTNPDFWIVNPTFAEWLMGYPLGWTKKGSAS